MEQVKISIVAWHDNYPPGIVECCLVDRFGRGWRLTLKQYDVTDADLDETSNYPLPGAIDCLIVARDKDEEGRESILIELDPPMVNLTDAGVDRFELAADQVITGEFRKST